MWLIGYTKDIYKISQTIFICLFSTKPAQLNHFWPNLGLYLGTGNKNIL